MRVKILIILLVVVGVAGGAIAFFYSRQTTPPPPFDPATLTWDKAVSSAPWEARDSAAAFVYQDKLWIMGGLDGNNVPSGAHHYVEYGQAPYFNDIWSSTNGVTWKLEATSSPWVPRRSMSVVDFKGTLYMFAGWSPKEGYQSDVWTSTDGVHWTKLVSKAAFIPREGQWAEVWNGKMWMTGGVNYEAHKTFNDVWYSTDGITWVEAPEAPWSSRWDHATAIYDNKMFLTGGMDLGAHKDNAFNDEWVTEDGMTWTKVTDNAVWSGRQGHALVPYHGYLWLLGRLNDDIDGGVNDAWYSKDGVSWVKGVMPGWSGREDHWALVFKDRIFVFSGMDNLWHWTNDVWVSATLPKITVPMIKKTAQALSITAPSYFSEYIDPAGAAHVLLDHNADTALPLASISKLMTAVIASEEYGLGARLDEVRKLLILSDNATADSLGSNSTFVTRMNNRAIEMHLTSMHFVNPSGLDTNGDLNVASARDVATLMKYLYTDRQALFEILGEKLFGDATSTDNLLFDTSALQVLGGKTGETPRAHQNLVVISKAPREGYIVSVVLGSDDRFGDMKKLLSYDASAFSW